MSCSLTAKTFLIVLVPVNNLSTVMSEGVCKTCKTRIPMADDGNKAKPKYVIGARSQPTLLFPYAKKKKKKKKKHARH